MSTCLRSQLVDSAMGGHLPAHRFDCTCVPCNVMHLVTIQLLQQNCIGIGVCVVRCFHSLQFILTFGMVVFIYRHLPQWHAISYYLYTPLCCTLQYEQILVYINIYASFELTQPLNYHRQYDA